jgi:hypothetical protein
MLSAHTFGMFALSPGAGSTGRRVVPAEQARIEVAKQTCG